MNIEDKMLYRLMKVLYWVTVIVFYVWLTQDAHKYWEFQHKAHIIKESFFDWVLHVELAATLIIYAISFLILTLISNIITETIIYIAYGNGYMKRWFLFGKRRTLINDSTKK